ncbi:hypothetical protein Plec18167_003351 [Paecilomyces lecythidis]|uniref:Uncharacterized protein n=1 Tax=Paecilomyces lecythidis TaxID=3004212 RepID=A0ABR3Y1F9_9EURO
MVKQFDSLKKVDEESRLSERNIEIRDANSTRSSGRGKRSLDSVRTARSSSGAVQAANVSVKSVSPMDFAGGSTVHVSNDNSDVEDAVASNADDDEGFAHGEETSETAEASSLHRSQEVGYGPIPRCGELLAMSVDSLEDTPAVSLVRAGRPVSSSRSSAIRVDDHLEALSESDFEIRQQSGVMALVEPLSNASDTTSCIEADSDDEAVKSESGDLDGEATDQRSKYLPPTELDDDPDALYALWLASTELFRDLTDTESLDMLIRFLKLCENRKPRDDVLYRQAGIWARSLWDETEITSDNMTFAWLWIFWTLGIKSELKFLSGFAWKHAQRPVDQIDNEHQVYLPQHIVDGIELKRAESLSKVENLMSSHIDIAQKSYTSAINDENPSSPSQSTIMGSSLIFGYLTLESQRWLSDSGVKSTTWKFDGVTVSDICQAARSIINLGHWTVRTVPPAEHMPLRLQGFWAITHLGSAGLHISDMSASFSSAIKNELMELVDQLENDDWELA